MLTLVCTACIAPVAAIPFPAAAVAGLPFTWANSKVRSEDAPLCCLCLGMLICSAQLQCQLQLCPSGELGQTQKQLELKEGTQFSFGYRCQERWREPDPGGRGWCCQQEFPKKHSVMQGWDPAGEREGAAGGLHGQGSRGKARSRTDGERRQND